MSRILRLTVSLRPFEVMHTGEKTLEYRKPGKKGWIRSRLYHPDGTEKQYDLVEIRHGYGDDRPWFRAVYLGFTVAESAYSTAPFSNRLIVEVDPGDYIIRLGTVTAQGNISH